MLLVPTYIAKSDIHGIGLFAAKPISCGMVVAEFMCGFDRVIATTEWPYGTVRQFLEHYGYRVGYNWFLNMDDLRFCNHSDTPNLITSMSDSRDIATRDIRVGEELTVDYYTFDEEAAPKLMKGIK